MADTARPMFVRLQSEPKGRWARHLQDQRQQRNLSQTQAFELVHVRMGWSAKSRTAYRAIDMGERQPSHDEAAILAEEFGWPPEPEINDDLEDPTLAAALLAIAGELRAAREERTTLVARVEEMDAVLRNLVARTTGAEAMPPAPHESAGSGR